jgi:hypothetical protein
MGVTMSLAALDRTAYRKPMVSIEEAAGMAMLLPEVVEGIKWGNRNWSVDGKGFAWERPLSKADIKRYGPTAPPEGPILAIAAEDLGEREAILAANRPGFFTISHFDGYAAYLIQLDIVDRDHLEEALVDGWLCCAPARLANEFLERQPPT